MLTNHKLSDRTCKDNPQVIPPSEKQFLAELLDRLSKQVNHLESISEFNQI
ncbi:MULTISPECIES: hypothetical protein [Arthrospira]|jgi:hypothetical protein|uniref:Uncharacterized protein n=1 Tax=Limnospira platensis NIES-46 TaxID=1236695 RepID=A0A5M3T556_LIMPL|nr:MULTISPECIES: hypothetical protein [Arthrospira]MBD2671266.1 hypothetical protein [Arthrospira platensis FACHB-439]MBD2712191.1 hypothetical protein [Arthrospira platensis FACHB-835]MDF2212005.1 hypothetical protein [Arthrospira platensis NCB002]MDT9184899.1 hypothetical protein [Limnospira sp. PMC 289.06]MDT9296475.1 hypothetical protein [Arthrospira platensis PCC 7345]MDT9312540.1 hypothetical protein [Limnospira sp. Paracas R14]QQW27908.1 hypothetical protein AP9108_22590 [Arthrospira 